MNVDTGDTVICIRSYNRLTARSGLITDFIKGKKYKILKRYHRLSRSRGCFLLREDGIKVGMLDETMKNYFIPDISNNYDYAMGIV